MSDVTQEQVIAYISGLRRGEVQSLIMALEETLGISTEPGPPEIAAIYGVPDVPDEPSEPETFDVVLEGYAFKSGRQHVELIMLVARLAGIRAWDSKEGLKALPFVVREGVYRYTAEEIRAKLVAVGVEVSIRSSPCLQSRCVKAM